MTNLLIAFPDVSYNISVESHTTENPDYPAENVQIGGRDERYLTSTAVTSSTIRYNSGSGNTTLPEYLIIAEAHKFTEKLVAESDLDIKFQTDDTVSFPSPQTSTSTIDSSDLIGPNNEDFLVDLTGDITTGERYHQVTIDTGTDSFVHAWSKVCFGTMFDIGRDPSSVSNYTLSIGRKTIRRLTLKWSGITDAKRAAFNSTIAALAGFTGFFLYDPADKILNSNKLLHVRLAAPVCATSWKNNNDITAEFVEIL